jgi:hypothetical protein
LLVRREDGSVAELTEKEEIEAAALEEYERRPHQTTESPLMRPPLVNDVQFLGVGPHAEAILAGTCECPEGTDQHARQYLAHLR